MARKILLADDSVTAQNMGRRILTDAGYEVITVNNGSAALKKIAELKPDIIVLDVYMPGYGGLEVCQRLKENKETARVPVLLSVGKLEPFKPDEARRVRADAYIVKPFEASELLTALTKLEDKIVPQPEPYKPGRFAKAIAAVEQSTDGFGDVESGWKERLNIPHPAVKHSEPEPEPPAKVDREFKRVAEFEHPAPTGLPGDITAEEIAAITAAAAALKAKEISPPEHSAGAKGSPAEQKAEVLIAPLPAAPEAPSETDRAAEDAPVTFASAQSEAQPEAAERETPSLVAEEDASEAKAVVEEATNSQEIAAATSTPAVSSQEPVTEATVSAGTDRALNSDAEVMAALASLGSASDSATVGPHSSDDLPSRSALAPLIFAGPRWIAESIPLSVDESTFVLEQEMEKQYAAFAAADAVCAALVARNSSESSTGEHAIAVVEPPHASSDQPQDMVGAPDAESPTLEEKVSVSTSEPEAIQEQPAAPDSAISEENGEAFAAAAGAIETSNAVASTIEPVQPQNVEVQGDSELAAAWANWKQIRESILGAQTSLQVEASETTIIADQAVAETVHEQVKSLDSTTEETARPEDESDEISDIVDNMLAELKPKLMKEIAKKLKSDKR